MSSQSNSLSSVVAEEVMEKEFEQVESTVEQSKNEVEANKSHEVLNSDSAETNETNTTDKLQSKYKKRKVVTMLSYCGQNYYGMQKNPGTPTIEGDLLGAMLKLGFIDDYDMKRPQGFGFQRAARTDKNVSAARQIVSMKVVEHFDMNKINDCLPAAVRVMGVKRVTKGFDAKLSCDARTYSYMTPTFAFAPMEISLTEAYRITPEVLENVRKLFSNYIGNNKNFHNFTSGKRPNDPSARRQIYSFVCGDPFEKDGLEYVLLRVKGQSFMLHQIRKMIGLCVAIARGFSHEIIFESAFGSEKIDIPKAPGLGLMLEEVHYDRYNKRFGADGVHEPLTWDEVKPQVEKFCDESIYPIVTKTEINEKSMWNWLATLVFHTYGVRPHDASEPLPRHGIALAAFKAAAEGALLNSLQAEDADNEDNADDDDGEEVKAKRLKSC